MLGSIRVLAVLALALLMPLHSLSAREPNWRQERVEPKGLSYPICDRIPVRLRPALPGIALDLGPDMLQGGLFSGVEGDLSSKHSAPFLLRYGDRNWDAELRKAIGEVGADGFGVLVVADAGTDAPATECRYTLELEPQIILGVRLDALYSDLNVQLVEHVGGKDVIRFANIIRSETAIKKIQDEGVKDLDERTRLWLALKESEVSDIVSEDLRRALELAQRDVAGQFTDSTKALGFRRHLQWRNQPDRMRIVDNRDGRLVLWSALWRHRLFSIQDWRTPP
jgi:hypothetical protein